MKACPACGVPGILQHSVLVRLDQIARAPSSSSAPAPQTYSRCTQCRAVFDRPGPDALVPVPPEALDGGEIWIVPPWKPSGEVSDFLASWDTIEAFFEQQAAAVEWCRPLSRLIGTMRADGLDRLLRAGQSLNSLGLSRSRAHGLREDQSCLFLRPRRDGRIHIEGSLAERPIELGPVDAELASPLRELLDQLIEVEID